MGWPYNKNSLKHYENNLKQFKTASTNGPWAYIWEGLLSEGFLKLRFGGLIFGRASFWRGLLSEFYGIDTLYPIPIVLAQPTMITGGFNPLSPKSDQ